MWTHSRGSKLYVRLGKKSGWSHGCDPPIHLPLGTSTHIEIRDVGGTFSVSFNGMVQCTTDYTDQVWPARTDYTNVTWAAGSRMAELTTQREVIQHAIGRFAFF